MDDRHHRVLALASEPLSRADLESALQTDPGRDTEVLVVAPALNSRVRHWLSDPDPAIERAEEVKEQSVAQLDAEGVDASGEVGESDPLLALQDALQTFPADEVVLCRHPDSDENWLEEGLSELARERFDVPVREVVCPAG